MTSNVEQCPNPARQVAAKTFAETLKQLRKKDDATETDFATMWTRAMAEDDAVSVNGWYDPPPNGVAVLSGLSRISFHTLRDQSSWPGREVIDWASGALYAYSSVVNTSDGTPGDFAITLYFGSEPAIRHHFLDAYNAVRKVLAAARSESSSRALFRHSAEIFSRAGLRNRVISYTDTTPLDLGHTYPVPAQPVLNSKRCLTPETRDAIRTARRFLNDDSDWDLRTNGQFTVEPQLVSSSDPGLPQVTFHYVIDPASGGLLTEPDNILSGFGLTG
jgi:hypothetical protein